MGERKIRLGIVSPERALYNAVQSVEPAPGYALDVVRDLRLSQLASLEAGVAEIVGARVDIAIIDLTPDPQYGLDLAQALADAEPGMQLIAAGPELPPRQLLAGMRAGISEYLITPVQPLELASAMGRLSRRLVASRDTTDSENGRVVAFLPVKGGTGTTTAAVNLALELHRATHESTIIVDLDLELGGVALLLGVRPRFSFLDLARNIHRLDAGLLGTYVERHSSGLHVLAAPTKPERSDVVSADEAVRIIDVLRAHYRNVVLDLSKSLSPLILSVVEAADLVVAVTTADLPALGSLKRLLPILGRLGGKGTGRLRIALNRYQDTSTVTLDDVRTLLEMPVSWTLANDYTSLIKAANEGKPVVLNGGCPYTNDIRRIAAEISETGEAPVNGRRTRGPFLRLFSRKDSK